MYPSIRTGPLRSATPGAVDRRVTPARRATQGIGRNVVNLGLTSLFTDISSESVTAERSHHTRGRVTFRARGSRRRRIAIPRAAPR